MKSTRHNSGSAILMVVVAALSIAILSLSYFRFVRESRHTEKWHEARTLAIEAAEIINSEACAHLHKSLKNQKSQVFWFLLGAVSGAKNELKPHFSRQHLHKIMPENYSLNFSCEMKVVNFKASAPDNQPYFGKNEGHGILALITRVEIFNSANNDRQPLSRYYLEVHHDYIVASMLSPDKSGPRLSNAIMVRKQRNFDNLSVIEGHNFKLLAYQNEAPPILSDIENMKVFDRYSLWARRNLTLKELRRLKIIDTDTRTLNLNGINHCREAITLDGQWQIRGQGVLIADSFVINDSIKKSDSADLAILYARRGKILINTGNEIHAALIAINKSGTGTVEASRGLNLNGMLLVDRLDLQNWQQNEHIIVFDKSLTDRDRAYRINVSRWINYRRSGEAS